MSAPRLIFVYGTLMEGEGNWSWALAPRKPAFLAQTLPGEFALLHLGGFPGMIRINDRDMRSPLEALSIVHGEVFEVPATKIPDLDRLEGHPRFYRREDIEVLPTKGKGAPVVVETYIYQGAAQGRGLIPSGSWRDRSLSL